MPPGPPRPRTMADSRPLKKVKIPTCRIKEISSAATGSMLRRRAKGSTSKDTPDPKLQMGPYVAALWLG